MLHIQNRTGRTGRPLVFGEVLFDNFAEGAVLGGAPFNVAWHLQGFGLNPLFISRVGQDGPAKEVALEMRRWGMDTRGLQRDGTYPTGEVHVTLEGDEPHFEILPQQAYDYIDPHEALQAAAGEKVSLVYQGTLAARSPVSRRALAGLIREVKAPVFIDVNLRPPWWDKKQTETFIRKARWAKMNEKELEELTGCSSEIQGAEKMMRGNPLDMLIVTLGDRGALLLAGGEPHSSPAAPVGKVVDTVGAGDAFSALCILGLVEGWEPSLILQRSLEFASRIVGQRGALPRDPGLYQSFRRRWEM